MSRFKKLAHVVWHCQYHIVWVPKYRYKVLNGKIGEEVRKTIIIQSERLSCEVVELNIQADHVHLLIKVPPKVSISSLMGVMKGKSAIRLFSKFPELKQRPYWGNHFWASGYCVDTVGLDSEMIRKYVKYQDEK
ncbi:MAG: IS200/IS605 family transposase [Methylococcaceae bacterium]|nr:IS200/IS605 family transposase [Methylococcaceae bacterium]MCF6249708.1 IS200/IS605 family transposase [Methylococcaceae bacterium]